jgi:hypothetical protein
MSTSDSRKQRRNYELWLKRTNKEAYKKWKSESVKRGNAIHEQNTEAIRNAESEMLEKKQTDIIVRMREEGKTEEQIDEFIAIWIKTIKTWGSDEPKLSLRKATKEYKKESKNSKK